MKIIEPTSAYILLALFAGAMIGITIVFSRHDDKHTAVGFMAAGRNVPWWLGAVSLAVTWIWAPALFVSVQQAYQQGIPGIFWFTFPNICCLLIMAPLALRIRRFLPSGYSQPEWIRHRFDSRTHKLYLIPFFWYQLMAVTVQLYAGGSIFSLLSGVPIENVMCVLAITTLAYGIISGMRASIITDFLQYALIVLGGLIIIPWTIFAVGGFSALEPGLGGLDGTHRSILDPEVAWNFGIVTTIGLISGVLADQQHWQRAFAIRADQLKQSYIIAGFLFGIVPIALASLGFIAANPALGIVLPAGVDPSMIGVITITKYLPTWAVVSFLVVLLAALCAVLDSGMCATAALFSINCFSMTTAELDVREKLSRGDVLSNLEQEVLTSLDRKILKRGRFAMIAITILGLLLAFLVVRVPGFGLKYLWWIFNTIATCIAVPTILSLYWSRLSSNGIFWGVLVAFVLGVPLFVYANYKDNPNLIVGCSVGILVVTLVFALLFPRKKPVPL